MASTTDNELHCDMNEQHVPMTGKSPTSLSQVPITWQLRCRQVQRFAAKCREQELPLPKGLTDDHLLMAVRVSTLPDAKDGEEEWPANWDTKPRSWAAFLSSFKKVISEWEELLVDKSNYGGLKEVDGFGFVSNTSQMVHDRGTGLGHLSPIPEQISNADSDTAIEKEDGNGISPLLGKEINRNDGPEHSPLEVGPMISMSEPEPEPKPQSGITPLNIETPVEVRQIKALTSSATRLEKATSEPVSEDHGQPRTGTLPRRKVSEEKRDENHGPRSSTEPQGWKKTRVESVEADDGECEDPSRVEAGCFGDVRSKTSTGVPGRWPTRPYDIDSPQLEGHVFRGRIGNQTASQSSTVFPNNYDNGESSTTNDRALPERPKPSTAAKARMRNGMMFARPLEAVIRARKEAREREARGIGR
ncbi:hypothetical protein G7046_g6774 [Stylonectria norvegica]|nr:hypothetical protein G7046_g6774 [Stylonectria norvegica]